MSNTATIKGFFNPKKQGDDFKGLNASIEGAVADRVIQDIPGFLKAAGRDYFIKKSPVYQMFGNEFAEVENQYHLVRSNDDRVVSPHTVSGQYAPLSLMDIADELQPWCDQGWCTPDGVYSGRNESLEVLTLRLDAGEGDLPNGERFMHYIMFQNPHGSGGTAKGKIISFRIVCANTFAAAVSTKADFAISHRVAAGDHEQQQLIMASRVEGAVAAWKKAKEHIAALATRIDKLSSISMNNDGALALTNKLLGINDPEKASTRSLNRRDAIMGGWNSPEFGTNGKTAWDWINGVTFANSSPYAEANRKSRVDAIDRMIRNVDTNGTGFKIEQNAEEIIADLMKV